MINTVSPRVEVRRSLDRSHHRRPLRVQITRRRTGKPAGAHQFVTQVRFGGAEAVVLPWELGAVADGPEALTATAER
jgi:hypothetical protein